MLRIMDHSFNIVDTVINPISVEFEKKFRDYGTFTVQIPESSRTENIKIDMILCHKSNYGVIRYIAINESGVIIKGIELKGILSQRYVYSDKSGKAEDVIKEYVSEAVNGENRNFLDFSTVSSEGRGKEITYSIEKPKMLDVVLKELCEEADLGYEITVKNKKMQFDIVVPSHLNYVYSKRRSNISAYEYSSDSLTEKNVAVNCIKNEDTEKYELTLYNKETEPNGIYRKEMICEYSEDAENECKQELSENSSTENITAELINAQDFGEIWNLGDYVKIRIDGAVYSMTAEKQITSLTECYEANKHTITPVFGEEKQSIITKILRKRG